MYRLYEMDNMERKGDRERERLLYDLTMIVDQDKK